MADKPARTGATSNMQDPEPPKIGPRKKTRANGRVCPGCGGPKRLGAHWCKRCAKLGPPGRIPPQIEIDPNARACTGPGKEPFSKACVGTGVLEPDATKRTRRCAACRKLLREDEKQRAANRKPRPGPEAVTDETAWSRVFHEKLQMLEAGRRKQESTQRYTTVKEERDGRTAYVTKVDMRARRGAQRNA